MAIHTTSSDRHRARLHSLVNISRQVADISGEQEILDFITREAQVGLGCDRAVIAMLDADGLRANVVAQVGFPAEEARRLTASRFLVDERPIAARVLREARTTVVRDSASTADTEGDIPSAYGTRSFAYAPLVHKGRVLGALGVFFVVHTHDWDEDEIHWLGALADQAALTLNLVRRMRAQRRDISLREALFAASRRLQAATDLDTVVQATVQGVAQLVHCSGVAVHLLNRDSTEATIVALWGYEGATGDLSHVLGHRYDPDSTELDRRSFRKGEAFTLDDFQTEPTRWLTTTTPTMRSWMSVPLLGRNRCLGKITVDHIAPGVFGPEELAIVQTFAAHAASGIERAHLYAEATRRADQLTTLYQVGQELLGAGTQDELYATLRKYVMQAMGADVFFVCLAHDENEPLEVPVYVEDGVDFPPQHWEPTPGPTSYVLRTGRTLVLASAAEFELYNSRHVGHTDRDSQSGIFAPLKWRDQTNGVLSVQSYRRYAFSSDDVQVFQALGTTAALALARQRSDAATAERAAQFAALAQSARALVSNLDLKEVLQSVVDRARELAEAEAFLMLYDESEDCLRVTAYAGSLDWQGSDWYRPRLEAGTGVTGAAFAEQQTVVVGDITKDERVYFLKGSPLRSLAVLPLTVGEQRLGLIELAWPEVEGATPERLAISTAFADHASLAIYNARQHDELLRREAERTALLRQVLTAQEVERKRVSLDLHDGPLQSLGVGLIHADTLRKRAETNPIVPADIDQLRRDFALVVDEVRGLIADLRPEVLDSYGLLPALEAHTRRINETTGLEIEINYTLEDRLPAYLEVLIYRLVQEALTNVRKHARATRAVLGIEADEGACSVIVRVTDDGRGFDIGAQAQRVQGYGVGLRSMRERMEGAGGEMRVESASGQGTTITFVLPLPEIPAERC
ncbi:MAG TPA: GAF domain-containing protein [Chloroflexia bacterium]|nr:GAF domain-containing protein [Chloroflexia bacterium]